MVTAILTMTLLGTAFGLTLGWVSRRFRVESDPVVDRIDAILPQTQCGQCNYPGCRPYAEAIAAGEAAINQCPPGGEAGIRALADLLGVEPMPLNPENGIEQPARVAVIDEAVCIGCTLCIQACPVDAIVGAPKLMHTVIESACTGCDLCLPPCPGGLHRDGCKSPRPRFLGMAPAGQLCDARPGWCDASRRERLMQLPDFDQAKRAGERLFRFPGGLRLRHNKKISCELPIERTALPTRFYVPLLQQAGEVAAALVAVGQTVLKGEPIGRWENRGGGFLHSPTSGTVTALARHAISHPSGMAGRCVVIKPDGLDRWGELRPLADWQNAEPETLRDRIHDAGIVGLGGAVFPTGPKVLEASRRGIHTLILNGAECEPYISCDEMLMRERPDSIVLGARILQRAVGAARTVIAIEDQMGAVHRALEQAVRDAGAPDLRIVKVTTIYPEGGERQLIQVLTGLEVPSGGRPTDLGLLCQNVATADAVARAVVKGKPLVERIVTVTGDGVRRPRNLLAAIGTPISNLMDQCGGYTEGAARLVLGGPMMGYALNSDDNPVIKAANCILVLTGDAIRPQQPEMPCIRCDECARVCPATLQPQQLHWTARNALWDETAEAGLGDCIECGCCDFVCPSHIPLVEWFRFAKSELHRLQNERQAAEAARRRFEARQERLARIKRERRQRMDEKKRALDDPQQGRERIAAAVERARARRRGDS